MTNLERQFIDELEKELDTELGKSDEGSKTLPEGWWCRIMQPSSDDDPIWSMGEG